MKMIGRTGCLLLRLRTADFRNSRNVKGYQLGLGIIDV